MAEDPSPNRVPGSPGAVSMFFIAKAAFFAAVAWAWLLYLIGRGDPTTGWELFAASAGICFTLVAVQLGVRYANQRSAALRQAELCKHLVDLSWSTAGLDHEATGRVLHMQPGTDRTRR
jgi:hypothetical protein